MYAVTKTSWYFLFIFLALPHIGECKKNTRPNIVIFIADDLGIGDVGCFGNDTIHTPYLDRMAAEGVKLTQHFAAASFCSPSRAALLTGRYPIRSGMAPDSSNILRFLFFLASSGGLPSNETTFGELAKSVGYKTAYIGKWHLGLHKEKYGDNEHSPINQGFDYFYGYPWTNAKDFGLEGAEIAESGFPGYRPALWSAILIGVVSAAMAYYHGVFGIKVTLLFIFLIFIPNYALIFLTSNLTLLNSILYRDNAPIEQPIVLQNLTQRFVQEGRKYIEERRVDQEPFLLVMSWVHVHTHIVTNPAFTGKSQYGRYGDGVAEMDWGVGQIHDALDKRGLGKNTFSYFTSDNGGHLEERGAQGEVDGGWNGVYLGGKTHGATEGAIRVPTIARWPARIPKNTSTNEPTIFMDVFPTIANIIGATLPGDRVIDGKDLVPLLTGKEKITKQKFMVHYCGTDVHAIRYRPDTGNSVWKLVFRRPEYMDDSQECMFFCTCYNAIKLETPHLFDINKDPGEKRPITDYDNNKKLKSIVSKMYTELEKHKRSVELVPNQFAHQRLMWNPFLQPCCGGIFPFCSCKE